MLLSLNTDTLKNALNKILSVVDKKNSRPILTYSLMTAKDGILEISATDLEVSSKVAIQANVENSGKFCVNAKNLFDILKELPSSDITLSLAEQGNSLSLSCGDIQYTLLIYKSDDYPHLVFENVDNQFYLKASQILNIIGKTSYAISNDETRLYLNGIFLQEIESKLRAVATDGHRLSLLETDLEDANIDTLINGIIIPKKGVFELKKIADNFPNEDIKISVDDSFMYASALGEYFLSIRLIAREYPKYQAVIPNKTTYTLVADKTTLFDAVRRIKIMSNEKSNGVRLNFTSQELTITANHPSLGNAKEVIPVEYNGKDMEIGFNAKYLIDTLTIFNDGDITMELNNELSPIVIKSNELTNFLGIIMPLKL